MSAVSFEDFQVQAIAGKGLGAFASRSYNTGEVVFEEEPLLMIEGDRVDYSPEQVQNLESLALNLIAEQSATLYSLSNVFSTKECSALVGIFKTNSFDMNGTGAALYPTLARLNHSCAPNCRQEHNTTTRLQKVTALRDIARGEELCICYIDTRGRNTSDRRRVLQQRFRFNCCCPLCQQHDSNPLLRRFMPGA